MKDDSNLIDQRGEQTDHLHSDTAEKKETTCVFTAQEVVRLNDMLSVKHVRNMLEPIHEKKGATTKKDKADSQVADVSNEVETNTGSAPVACLPLNCARS